MTDKPLKSGRKTKPPVAASITGFDFHRMLATVGNGSTELNFGLKDVLFRQGDPADSVFYLTKGSVDVTTVSEQGKEGLIAGLGNDSFLGEGCLAGQPLRMASAVSTATDTVAIKIKKSTMMEALHNDVEFAEVFTAYLLTRNIQIEEDLVDHLFNSSEKRLARTLLMLAHFGKDGALEMVIPKVTQDVLAAQVGTTRSRINFFMNKFRKLGFIEYNGTLKVHSSLLNVIVYD